MDAKSGWPNESKSRPNLTGPVCSRGLEKEAFHFQVGKVPLQCIPRSVEYDIPRIEFFYGVLSRQYSRGALAVETALPVITAWARSHHPHRKLPVFDHKVLIWVHRVMGTTHHSRAHDCKTVVCTRPRPFAVCRIFWLGPRCIG